MMKKFSDFKFRRINEQEITLPTGTQSQVEEETQEINGQQGAEITQQPQPQEQQVQDVVKVQVSVDGIQQGQTIQNTEQQEETVVEEVKVDTSKLFSKLFESREMAHVYHLQVRGDEGSFSSHKALNIYYAEVLELIDELIEIYQGQYEIVDNYETIDTTDTKTKDKIEYFQELVQFVKDCRYTALLQEDTHLQNIVDEIVALIYKTLYRLKYNK